VQQPALLKRIVDTSREHFSIASEIEKGDIIGLNSKTTNEEVG
jgi:hypothetical protein